MIDWIILGTWVANYISCLGAFESGQPYYRMNPLKMNIFFGIANLYSIFYFIVTLQISFIFLQLVFLTLSIRGIINNYKIKNEKEPILRTFFFRDIVCQV